MRKEGSINFKRITKKKEQDNFFSQKGSVRKPSFPFFFYFYLFFIKR